MEAVVQVAEDAVDSESAVAGRERDWAASLLTLPRSFVAIGFVFASNSCYAPSSDLPLSPSSSSFSSQVFLALQR